MLQVSFRYKGGRTIPQEYPSEFLIYLDGKERGEATADLNRSDVPEADPKIRTPNVGWRYDLDYRGEMQGMHTLEVFPPCG